MRYEDLIADDVTGGREVFDFLGIEFTGEVRAFCESQAQQRTPLSGPTRDLSDAGRSEWSQVLDGDDQARSLALIGDQLRQLGYL
jgi:hypothetical protein